MSAQVLGRDIDEIREKVERMKEKRNNESEGVRLARQGVEQCYLCASFSSPWPWPFVFTDLATQHSRGQAAGLLETSRGVQGRGRKARAGQCAYFLS